VVGWCPEGWGDCDAGGSIQGGSGAFNGAFSNAGPSVKVFWEWRGYPWRCFCPARVVTAALSANG